MGNAQALPWSNNWACSAIRDLMLAEDTDAEEVARVLSREPRFIAVIQKAIDRREQPNYDPYMPDGDPAQGLIGDLAKALTAT